MPLIELLPVGNSQTCSINEDGIFTFPQQVLERLNWQVPCKVSVTYIAEPLTILFRRAEGGQLGFSLSHQNRQGNVRSSGKIRCARFANEVLRTRVIMPIRGLYPIYPNGNRFQMALVLEQPQWKLEEFSQAGLQRLPADAKGVYQLLSNAGAVLRIGEGVLGSRLRDHLKDERFSTQVRYVRYIVLLDKEETSIMEKIMLAQYHAENNQLPPLNLIRA